MKNDPVPARFARLRRLRDRAGESKFLKRIGAWPLWAALGLILLVVVVLAVLGAGRPQGTFSRIGSAINTDGAGPAALEYSVEPDALARKSVSNSSEPAQPNTGGGQTQPQTQPQWDRMIIRTATLQMKVESVAASMDNVRMIAASRGGYVTQSESRTEGEHLYTTITIQVPAREFDTAITELRKLGVKPATENISSSDVTEEFTDLQSQLRNFEQTETRIFALMQKAERIEDILNLDRELRNIRSEIERIQGRLNFLSKRAEMSTITVSLAPEIAPVKPTVATTTNAWDPSEIALRAWNASLDLLAGIGNVLITGAVYLWWAFPILLIVWLVMRPRRRAATPVAPPSEA